MAWCPKCRTEYRDGYFVCSDCGSELVEFLQHKEEYYSYDSESYLMSVKDRIEADIIEEFLKSSGIPVLRKIKGAGAYMELYLGMSNTGVDLYVPESMLERAKKIVAGEFLTPDEHQLEEIDEDYDEYKANTSNKRKQKTWIIILFFIPGLAGILIGLILFILSFL